MSCEHFLYSPETAFGTWVTPARGIPVESAGLTGGREVIDLGVTGSCRAPYLHVLGAKALAFNLVTPWWNSHIGSILKTFLRDTATTGGGDPYTHGFVPDDTTGLLGISIQQHFNGTLAQNTLSAVASSWTIAAAVKEQVRLTFAFIAKDEARVGEDWEYGGGASPSLVANPGSLYPAIARPLMFYDATLTVSGTPSYNDTTNVISVSGGLAYAKALSCEIALNNNVDADGFGLTNDPTVKEVWPQAREVTVTFEMSWTDYSTTLYDAARAGTAMAFQLDLVGTGDDEGHVIVPSVFFNPMELPPISGDKAKRTVTLTGRAQYDSVTGQSFNAWIKSPEATI